MSYIPNPLGRFLDDLRNELTPGADPRAHVTVLPPRPLTAEIPASIARLTDECQLSPPFEVTLGPVKVFEKTSVLYVSLARGEAQLHTLHENLNCGMLEYDGPFIYHPHVTVAQDIQPEQVPQLLALANDRWAAFAGSRTFTVDTLSFVQNVAPGAWLDIAQVPLAMPVGAL